MAGDPAVSMVDVVSVVVRVPLLEARKPVAVPPVVQRSSLLANEYVPELDEI
jgi:hypothetical protein